jgi:hypothetical protein
MVTKSTLNKLSWSDHHIRPADVIRHKIEKYDIMKIMKIIHYKPPYYKLPTLNKQYELEHWLKYELKMECPYDEIKILKGIYQDSIRLHQDYHTIKNALIIELINTAKSHRSKNNLPTVVRFYNSSYMK